jgi:hypothetical protein
MSYDSVVLLWQPFHQDDCATDGLLGLYYWAYAGQHCSRRPVASYPLLHYVVCHLVGGIVVMSGGGAVSEPPEPALRRGGIALAVAAVQPREATGWPLRFLLAVRTVLGTVGWDIDGAYCSGFECRGHRSAAQNRD